MKKNSKSPDVSNSTAETKTDPTFLPKARVLIKKIKAKLSELEAGSAKKTAAPSAPKKKSPAKRPRSAPAKKARSGK